MTAFSRTTAFNERAGISPPIAVVRCLVLSSVGALLGIGGLLAARRLAGALTAELAAFQLAATALVAGMIVFGGRYVWRQFDGMQSADRRLEQLVGWGGSLALLLLAAGCSISGRVVDWGVWLPLVAADQWQLRWFLKEKNVRRRRFRIEGSATGEAESQVASDASLIPPLAPPFEGGGFVLQQLVRVRKADGGESVYGTLRAEFVAGQRHATLHVGFCPPLERLPVVEAAVGEGPEAEVKVVQAFCHGARLELRLQRPAEEDCAALIEVSAKPQAEGGAEGGGSL